eukprot:2116331-Pyramimonas_sp.AAC.1
MGVTSWNVSWTLFIVSAIMAGSLGQKCSTALRMILIDTPFCKGSANVGHDDTTLSLAIVPSSADA